MSARASAGNRGEVRGVFVFALLAAFALLSLIVVVVGARSYRMINDTAEQAFVSRTGMSYLVGKVRGADAAGQFAIRDENGMDVLTLGQTIEGARYVTYIYCDGEHVCEYFAREDLAFSPSYGEQICPANEMRLTLEDHLLTISLMDSNGEAHAVSLYLQAAKEGGL